MNILIDPVEMADRLIAQCHLHRAGSYWTIFGRWCDKYGQAMPSIYIQAVASHIMSRADNPMA